MKTILISSLISAIAVILIPTSFSQKVSVPVNDVVLHIQTNQHTQDTLVQEATQSLESTGKTIRLLVDDEVHCVEFEKYLSQVLMSEMPMSFELEALKAQAVAARTFAEKRMQNPKHSNADICSDSACCQAWTSLDGLKEKFGDAFDANYEKANTAVSETSGEVLLYNNELIDATYFSCSGGNTEAAVAVWGSEVP